MMAGDPCLIPESRSSPGEGIGYPPHYSWGSLVAHIEKNPPAMWTTLVLSQGLEDPLEEDMATTPVFLSGESLWTEEPSRLQSMESQRVRHD